MKNFNQMLKQAQQLQTQVEGVKARLGTTEYSGSSGSGLVKLVINGMGDLKKIEIDPKLLEPGEKEMLEDLIIAAFKDGQTKADQQSQLEMQKLNLPAGMRFP